MRLEKLALYSIHVHVLESDFPSKGVLTYMYKLMLYMAGFVSYSIFLQGGGVGKKLHVLISY